jgi:hypothetical protein
MKIKEQIVLKSIKAKKRICLYYLKKTKTAQ